MTVAIILSADPFFSKLKEKVYTKKETFMPRFIRLKSYVHPLLKFQEIAEKLGMEHCAVIFFCGGFTRSSEKDPHLAFPKTSKKKFYKIVTDLIDAGYIDAIIEEVK